MGKGKECKVRKEELAEQGQKAGVLQRSKLKKEAKELEEQRRGWSELAVFWQSVRHLHENTGKSGGKQMVATPHTPTCPPPYAPPTATAPTPGLYPTLYVTSGTLQVGESNTGSASETSGSTEYKLLTPGASKFPYNPFRDGHTRDGSFLAPPPSSPPFSQRQAREQAPQHMIKREVTPQPQRQVIRGSEISDCEEEAEAAGAASFQGKGQWEGERQEVPVSFSLAGTWREDEEDSAVRKNRELDELCRREIEELCRKRDGLVRSVEKGMKVAEELTDTIGRRVGQRRRGGTITPVTMYPLTAVPGQGDQYRPFTIGDIQAIVEKLPPVAEGGNLWLSKLDSLTAGQTLALGDFRAIAGRCMTGGDTREIETIAHTHRMTDDTPFTHHSTEIGKAMREKYPLPNATVMPKMRWDPKQNPREYVDQSKDLWSKHTGCHPGKAGAQREWFRQAILDGVPENVKTAMVNNPDMLGSESHVWEKHLIHHLTRAQDNTQKEQDDLKELQVQLLKLQLTEARQKCNDKNKKQKGEVAKVMLAAEPPQVPDLFPVPPWVPQPPSGGRRHVGGSMRGGGFGGRGRGLRGGTGRGQSGETRCCYLCGDPNHWIRNCPQNPRAERGMDNGPPGRGRGRNSGPPVTTPMYPQRPWGTAGSGQYPLWDDGENSDQSGQY